MANFKYLFILFIMSIAVVQWVAGDFDPFGVFDPVVKKSEIYHWSLSTSGNQRIENSIDKVDSLKNFTDVKLIIHGWQADPTHPSIVHIPDAYLAVGHNCVFVGDWNSAAGLDYATSRYLITKVALVFCKIFQAFLDKLGIPTSKAHIIGHSLGAHVGAILDRCLNGNVAHLTGLDPAYPLFYANSTDRFGPDAAEFVDVLHTDGGVYGDPRNLGHADFYVNGGTAPQPNCSDGNAVANLVSIVDPCSHNSVSKYYALSIQYEQLYRSIECNPEAIKTKSPEECSQGIENENKTSSSIEDIYMGDEVSENARGLYYVKTTGSSP